ncbi:MAG TPA: hypothetical protein VHT94_11840, partial [Streptosporangiaceae bacterium]|nr:hypothetical protein [Streptosporangiaceae bacterium]
MASSGSSRAAVVAAAVPPVAGLVVAVGVGCAVTVGEGVADGPVAVPLGDGIAVGVAVAPPDGAVVAAAGDGVGVQATTGSAFFGRGFCAALPAGAVLTPSGSFHRLEFAVVPPRPSPELGLDVETELDGPIRVCPSWL